LVTQLSEALALFAGHRRILIASDFDGTLSHHGPDLDSVAPVPGAEDVINAIAGLSNVTVMLVSGRRLDDLRPRFPDLAAGVIVVGEHGSEWPDREPTEHPAVDPLVSGLGEIAAAIPGAVVERKLFGLTLRHRGVDVGRVEQLLEETAAFMREAASNLGVSPRVEFGRGVVDVSLLSTTKGDAVQSMRRTSGADAVLFFGDDVSDESVFEVLGSEDVGVKVGPAPSIAHHRVPDPRHVVAILEELLYLRQ
jgi:trehalose 6-phosphate phosphatase